MKYLIILLLLSSCSKSHWQSRGYKKNWLKTDSVTLYDTILGYDTLILRQFDTLNHTDTLTIIKDGIKVKTIVKWKDRIIEQQITKRDTIVKFKYMETKVTADCPKIKWWQWWYIGVIGTLVVLIGLIWLSNKFGLMLKYLK